MIQFNHPCNICLRHIRGSLPRESRVWTGLPLGRFDAWTIETQTPPPRPPGPPHPHICTLSHTHHHTQLCSVGCVKPEGTAHYPRVVVVRWEDGVMSLSYAALALQTLSSLEIHGGLCVAFRVGAGGVFVLVQRRCASSWTTWDCQHCACGSSRRLPAGVCCVSVFVGRIRAGGSGGVWDNREEKLTFLERGGR